MSAHQISRMEISFLWCCLFFIKYTRKILTKKKDLFKLPILNLSFFVTKYIIDAYIFPNRFFGNLIQSFSSILCRKESRKFPFSKVVQPILTKIPICFLNLLVHKNLDKYLVKIRDV